MGPRQRAFFEIFRCWASDNPEFVTAGQWTGQWTLDTVDSGKDSSDRTVTLVEVGLGGP